MVDLRGEEEKVEEGRQKINQKLLYTKDPKKSINIPLPVSHSNRHHYRDSMMKVSVETNLQEFKFLSPLYHFQFTSGKLKLIHFPFNNLPNMCLTRFMCHINARSP